MFKNKQLEYVERAFEIERYSYDRLINHLRVKISNLETALEGVSDTGIEQLKLENEQLKAENESLTKELGQCGKKLSAVQYKEYKRLKQKEYNQRYLKKKAQKSSK